MPNQSKGSALIVMAFAGLFYFFFMAAKHDPTFSSVNAFANDPFDAIGSFGVQAAALLGVLCLIRAFRPYPTPGPSQEDKVLLARTEALVVLAGGITVAGDIVAMVRNPMLWMGTIQGYQLVAFLGLMLLLTLGAGVLTQRLLHQNYSHSDQKFGRKVFVASVLAVVILTVYPHNILQSLVGALGTVILGAILLFTLMWSWGMWLIPYQSVEREMKVKVPLIWDRLQKYQWASIVLLGVFIGFLLVLAESIEAGRPQPLLAHLFVLAVYVGLETTGLLIGFGMLRKALGFPDKGRRKQTGQYDDP
jgi:hypothetical protein